MAASTAQHSHNTKFLIADGGGGSYVELGEVQSISGPTITWDATEITHLTSDNAFKEYLSGLGDSGSVSLVLNYKTSESTRLYALSRTTKGLRVTFPDNSDWDFNGFPTSFGTESPFNDRITQSVEFKLTGKAVYSAS